ncbi:dTDP-4-dehydrorhamnose 3,5-epimerase family protein [Inhella sp.]|uniref:dTDP-4-dehydrorhamnose 3,5-epimerase family protein n=1 Tax=Inhella sp. TaxID=1921806 RepID=UPI0035AFECCA
MRTEALGLPGCSLVHLDRFEDERGCFVKTYQRLAFEAAGMEPLEGETFYTVSHQGVLRGMHFQTPPSDLAKLVHCLAGRVLDVILDLRRSSPTYMQHRTVLLDGTQSTAVYLPHGIAHGFLALSDGATMAYQVSKPYNPSHDAGIRWDSFGFDWPIAQPLLSERDQRHPALADFDSPFA